MKPQNEELCKCGHTHKRQRISNWDTFEQTDVGKVFNKCQTKSCPCKKFEPNQSPETHAHKLELKNSEDGDSAQTLSSKRVVGRPDFHAYKEKDVREAVLKLKKRVDFWENSKATTHNIFNEIDKIFGSELTK